MCCWERPGPRPPGRSCIRCVRLRCRSALVFQSAPQDAAHGVPVGLHRFACATAPRAFAASFMHPQHPPRVPPRFAHCGKTEHMPHETRRPGPHPRKSSPSTGLPAAYPRKSSPNTAPPAALPRKNSPSKPKNTNFGVFSARWANFFALAPTSSRAGRTFSRTGRGDMATLKPMTPPQPLMHATMKPPSPLLGPEQRPLKPTTPLQPKNTRKTPNSHPQRR